MIAADTDAQLEAQLVAAAAANGGSESAPNGGAAPGDERSHAEVVLQRMGGLVETIDAAIHSHITAHGGELLGGVERLVELCVLRMNDSGEL